LDKLFLLSYFECVGWESSLFKVFGYLTILSVYQEYIALDEKRNNKYGGVSGMRIGLRN
jgi:hypothetical protein